MKRSKGKKIQPQLHLFGETNYFVCATESNVKGKNNNNCSIWNWNTSCAAVRQKAPHRNITLNVNFFVLNVLKKWKISKEIYQRVIHNIHKQSHPANERVFVWVSEWKKKVDGTMLIAVLYISSCVQCAKLLASLILFPHHERKISTR